MDIEKIKTNLTNIVQKYPSSYSTIIKYGKRYSELRSAVEEYTAEFDDLPFPTRIYFLLNDVKNYVKCKICGGDIPHDRRCHAIRGYDSLCCCHSCAQKDPEHVEKMKKLSLERYGVERPQQAEEVKAKASATYAARSEFDRRATNEKRRKTCLEKYGVDSISKLDTVKKTISEIWKSKTRKELDERNEKTKLTNIERYGVERFYNAEKTRKTRLEKLSKDPGLKQRINEKRRKTCLEKYGVEYMISTEKAVEAMRAARYGAQYDETISKYEDADPLFSKEEYIANPKGTFKWKCRACGDMFESEVFKHQLYLARCMKCHPLNAPASKPQNELLDFIKSFYKGNTVVNSRDVIPPYELDIYFPERKLAIEFDGLYWHSDDMVEKNYHLNKTDMCEKNGIQLVHVFENEWTNKKEIVMSRIENMFGVYDKTVYARKCSIMQVPAKDAGAFTDAYHIQGKSKSSVNIGLYYENELISLMTFGKCRFSKKYEWEMLRFCSKTGYHIPGGAGRLLKYFEKTFAPKSLVTYADRRWSMGKLYKTLGFKLDHISKPDYWYWKPNAGPYLESRMKYQKHKLKYILKLFDETKSESENMRMNSYRKIYDCGNYVFVKTYDD